MRLISIVLLCLLARTAWADTAILFLVDASASMRSEISSNLSRWQVVQGVLINDLLAMPAESNVGLRVFGHRESESNAKKSCTDSELVQPIRNSSETDWQSKLNSLKPKGLTALAYSLQEAGQDLLNIKADKKVLILLSDGVESCGGKPEQVMKELKSKGLDLVVHIIGFAVDSNADRQLNAVASAVNGKYQKADTAVQLLETLAEITYSVLPQDLQSKWQGVSEIGDAGQAFDSNEDDSISIDPNLKYQASLGSFDTADAYSFNANQGEKFIISLSAIDQAKLNLEIYFKNQKVLGHAVSNDPEVFTAEHAGNYQFIVSLRDPTEERFKYSISLVKQVSFN